MLTYFAVFSALVICAGRLGTIFYEWRRDFADRVERSAIGPVDGAHAQPQDS
jgi:hypothetical protein